MNFFGAFAVDALEPGIVDILGASFEDDFAAFERNHARPVLPHETQKVKIRDDRDAEFAIHFAKVVHD